MYKRLFDFCIVIKPKSKISLKHKAEKKTHKIESYRFISFIENGKWIYLLVINLFVLVEIWIIYYQTPIYLCIQKRKKKQMHCKWHATIKRMTLQSESNKKNVQHHKTEVKQSVIVEKKNENSSKGNQKRTQTTQNGNNDANWVDWCGQLTVIVIKKYHYKFYASYYNVIMQWIQ